MKVVTFLFAFYVIRFILHKLFSLTDRTHERMATHKNGIF